MKTVHLTTGQNPIQVFSVNLQRDLGRGSPNVVRGFSLPVALAPQVSVHIVDFIRNEVVQLTAKELLIFLP